MSRFSRAAAGLFGVLAAAILGLAVSWPSGIPGRPPIALEAHVLLLGAVYFASAALISCAAERLAVLRGAAFAAAHGLAVAAFLQASFSLLVARKLQLSNHELNRAYRSAINRSEDQLVPRFVEHHYLNFALNPRQGFHPDYHIRRSEPLRPRSQAASRVLVLGGSTTFDAQIDDEERTWVRGVERRVRTECPGCDVINGGVMDYTVAENFIHYLVLLHALDPDVLVLRVGLSDVHARLAGPVKSDYSNYRRRWRAPIGAPNPRLRPLAPYRYYWLSKLERGLTEKPHAAASPETWPAALKANPPQVFESYLDRLIRLALAEGRRVALIPERFEPRVPSDHAFLIGVLEHNRLLEATARRHGLPFLKEAARLGSAADGSLASPCHFSPLGAQRMAAVVFEFLKKNRLLAGSRSRKAGAF